MNYNIDILLLKNDGYSIDEIINILPYDKSYIEHIFNNDSMEIIY
jgi:hypothetical protein